MTLQEIAAEAERLDPQDRIWLIQRLQASLDAPVVDRGVTREGILADFDRRKAAGLFENVESLYGKYAGGADVSQEELDALFHEIGTEWEQELDEFFGDD